jgi:hypothetical protein
MLCWTFSLAIGNHFIATDHGSRRRKQVLGDHIGEYACRLS